MPINIQTLDSSFLVNSKLSSKNNFYAKNIVFLAALSGFTTGKFAIDAAKAGAGAVTIGGFCLDQKTYRASQQMRARGRAEFSIPPEGLINYINPSLEILEELAVPVFINVRYLDLDTLENFTSEISFRNIIIELNAHCRQPEICNIGAGQEFSTNLSLLQESLDVIPSRMLVSLKIRGNDPRNTPFVKLFDNLKGDVLHVDAYQKGVKSNDMALMEHYRKLFNGFLIANNSITASTAIQLLNKGINAFSVGRRAQFNSKAPYELWLEIKKLIKNINEDLA